MPSSIVVAVRRRPEVRRCRVSATPLQCRPVSALLGPVRLQQNYQLQFNMLLQLLLLNLP